MSSGQAGQRLLIIEGETQLGVALRNHFEAQGYEAQSTDTAEEGLRLAHTVRPRLVLLSARLPDQAGLDVFRALRDAPRTSHIPVMVMAGRDETVLQNKVLEEGAYDFIEKPLDLDILTLRVRNALRRAEREGLTEPRTGLPTGRLIEERSARLSDEKGWYRIDLALSEFSVFRDLYGFVTANEALRFAGNLVCQVVEEHGNREDFIGHPNGAEAFVIITTQQKGPTLRNQLASRVSEELKSFYNFMEREQGYVEIDDGSGGTRQKPLMSAQATVQQGDPDPDAPLPPVEDAWVDAEEPGADKPDAENPDVDKPAATSGDVGDAGGDDPFDW